MSFSVIPEIEFEDSLPVRCCQITFDVIFKNEVFQLGDCRFTEFD